MSHDLYWENKTDKRKVSIGFHPFSFIFHKLFYQFDHCIIPLPLHVRLMAGLAAFSIYGFSNLHMRTQLLMFAYVVKLEKLFANVNSLSIQKLKRQPVHSVAAGLEAV